MELAENTQTFNTSYFEGCSTMVQGQRQYMEDYIKLHTIQSVHTMVDYFSIFDGHGGDDVAKYLKLNMHKKIELFLQNASSTNNTTGKHILNEKFFTRLFVVIDNDMKKYPKKIDIKRSGSTGTVVTLQGTIDTLNRTDNIELNLANVGDSTCIASINGVLKQLSKDHSPDLPEERDRIYKAGGWVEYIDDGWYCATGATLPGLAMSRAFGDFNGKDNSSLPREEQIIIVDPFVSPTYMITPEWDFVLLASDGVWNGFAGIEDVKNFVLARRENQTKVENICKDLAKVSLNSWDNIAIVLIFVSLDKDRNRQNGTTNTETFSTRTVATPMVTNQNSGHMENKQIQILHLVSLIIFIVLLW